MTKKKRELIEILFDNVKPEDWSESFPYAAQDKCDATVYVYSGMPDSSSVYNGAWVCGPLDCKYIITLDVLCKHWNKTIVHRDEFMKRWNERHPVVDSEGWIQWDGGEMPVEKGTRIDVKYRCGIVNLHVRAGELPGCGSITYRHAIDFKHDDNPDDDIIAYRLHVQKEQKTPQQLALEKFGTDWHDNEGVKPVGSGVMVDVMYDSGTVLEGLFSCVFIWNNGSSISKWRIHSDEKESHSDHEVKLLACDDSHMASEPVRKSPLETQIGGNHYTKLAIQPMRYSMENGLDALQHTIIKYVTRFRDKAGIEDLEKAKHCIDMLIEFEKESK